MRRPVRFEPVDEAVREAVTKLGGQPVWLGEPQWPISASLGVPMCFIGQFQLPDAADGSRLAYLFMTDGEDHVDGTWAPDSGENALIVQPDGQVPGFVATQPLREGPSIPARDHLPVDDPTPDRGGPWEFLGGKPVWLQGKETPGRRWRLVAQLSDHYGNNFGDAGIGYAFVSPDGKEGRFLWQCG